MATVVEQVLKKWAARGYVEPEMVEAIAADIAGEVVQPEGRALATQDTGLQPVLDVRTAADRYVQAELKASLRLRSAGYWLQ